MKEKSITFWELVLMNVSALYGIRWIAKSTSDSFGLGLGAIPMWIIFMLLVILLVVLNNGLLLVVKVQLLVVLPLMKEIYKKKGLDGSFS